jgi:hypothetical protein
MLLVEVRSLVSSSENQMGRQEELRTFSEEIRYQEEAKTQTESHFQDDRIRLPLFNVIYRVLLCQSRLPPLTRERDVICTK